MYGVFATPPSVTWLTWLRPRTEPGEPGTWDVAWLTLKG
jgi:hypothetical protein